MALADSLGVDSQDLTDLRVRQILKVDHSDQLPLRVIELTEDGLCLSVDGILHDRICVLLRRLNILGLRIKRKDLGFAALTVLIDQGVPGNVCKPGPFGGNRWIIGVIVLHCFDEDFADKILGTLPVKDSGIHVIIYV